MNCSLDANVRTVTFPSKLHFLLLPSACKFMRVSSSIFLQWRISSRERGFCSCSVRKVAKSMLWKTVFINVMNLFYTEWIPAKSSLCNSIQDNLTSVKITCHCTLAFREIIAGISFTKLFLLLQHHQVSMQAKCIPSHRQVTRRRLCGLRTGHTLCWSYWW